MLLIDLFLELKNQFMITGLAGTGKSEAIKCL